MTLHKLINNNFKINYIMLVSQVPCKFYFSTMYKFLLLRLKNKLSSSVTSLTSLVGGSRECSEDEDCPLDKACISGKCQDPCKKACRDDYDCEVRNHIPTCSQRRKVQSKFLFLQKNIKLVF